MKTLRSAKLRLADVLTGEQRRELALAMLHDVVEAVRAIGLTANVLSPDPEVLAFGQEVGAEPLQQPRGIRSLNGALEWALGAAIVTGDEAGDRFTPSRTLPPQGGGAASESSRPEGSALDLAMGSAALVILPDTPLVSADEIVELVAVRAEEREAPVVALAPDRRDAGTNAMLLRPPDALPVSFGRGSFRRHVRAAAERGVELRIHRLPGLGLDIDLPEDIDDFMRVERDTRTRRLLERWKVAAPRV